MNQAGRELISLHWIVAPPGGHIVCPHYRVVFTTQKLRPTYS